MYDCAGYAPDTAYKIMRNAVLYSVRDAQPPPALESQGQTTTQAAANEPTAKAKAKGKSKSQPKPNE
jgi:hypothetical protein